ncbi:putative inositol-1-monophosphatase [Naematelia encephala]|uniref:Inositol-1-monophosphatase n=1 Tax=Naematelia encephala TaxID=71784 RepID=A0A1Y2BJI1_9TREE|nr:putative inositol-1-monophosphatase [Naematelia encephala]
MPEDHSVYQELLEFAYGLAQEASDLILDGSAARWKALNTPSSKKNSVDLVTETDRAVEDMIKRAIASRYPSHKFIGEESYDDGERQSFTDEFTWIIDPIDPTTWGSLMQSPFVACSIGLTHNSKPVVGVIALPFMNQIYSARLGGGAFLNGSIPLPLTGGIPQLLGDLSQCLIIAEWGSDRSAETFRAKAATFVRLAGDPSKGVEGGVMAHALRTSGSTVYNLTMIAAGQADVYPDAGCYAWDVCAGSIILQEAGGFFSGGKQAFSSNAAIGEILFSRRYVAVRPVAATSTETSEQIQRRIVRELYEVMEEWTTSDM